MLACETQQAIWLRSLKIAAGGPAAKREARLMVREMVSAARTPVARAASGTGSAGVARGSRRKVRADLRRLSR